MEILDISKHINDCLMILNTELFEGKLSVPTVSLIPSVLERRFMRSEDAIVGSILEVTTGALLKRPPERLAADMVHELVHEFNRAKGVLDTSGSGHMYHNKLFRREAEAHGLIVTRSEKYGWSHTEPGEALIDIIIKHDEVFKKIDLRRAISYPSAVHRKEGTHQRKYQCPVCGASVRATKELRIICGGCHTDMEQCDNSSDFADEVSLAEYLMGI